MAEGSAQDVVNEAQSMGDVSLIGVSGNTFTSNATGEGEGEGQLTVGVDKSGDFHVATSSYQETPIVEPGATQTHHTIPYSATDKSEFIYPQANSTEHVQNSDTLTVDSGLVNGVESASFAGSEDAGYQNFAGTDESVTSDTDINKIEAPELTADQNHHRERSNSVKKPAASFKTVSVTKNFLAKSGATTALSNKLSGERVSVGSQSTTATSQPAKPRLVAKTGRDARSLNTGSGVATSSGPDASKVWNRNRPTPQPPPKQFTDEELKQQYGIHMATRLQADESGKESKWADIDDDEDDWAPETVQWMDGTKSTLLATETQPPVLKTSITPQPTIETSETSEMPALPTQTSSSSVSSIGKTILRPGARVTSQTRPGLVLKTVPEKTLQPEKPQPTSTSKSPWAQLPPVDKASPITFHPPPTTSQPMPPIHSEQAVQDEEPVHVQSPAREIAADDFDRSWRDNGDKGGRELFNSQSGRYEPVKNMRRPSRQEGGFRPPSVLQRPSSGAPAEPSAAFQTRESRSWGQRRDSSSHSHGPAHASFDRRSSVDVEPRGQQQVNKSLRPQQPDPVPDAMVDVSPDGGEKVEPVVQAQLPANPIPEQDEPSANSVPEQDPRAIQQQLMRERIERNRKRKQEEEAREEAERKERIRLKMEALGPASPSAKQSKPAESKSAQPLDTVEADSKPVKPAEQTKPEDVPASARDQQPPVNLGASPLKAGAPQLNEQSPLLSTTNSEVPATSRPPIPSSISPVEASKSTLADNGNSSANSPEVQLPGLGQPMPADRQPRSWNRMPANLEPPLHWGSKPISQTSGSVWSPWTVDRQMGNAQLGNGAFENEMSRVSSSQIVPNSQMGPGPLRASSMSSFDAANLTSSPPPHMAPRPDEMSQSTPPLPQNILAGPPFPQAPFQQHQMRSANDQRHQPQPPLVPSQMSQAKRAWHNFAANAANEDAARKEQADREWAAQLAEDEQNGTQQDYQPVFRETFRQTTPGDTIGQRRVVSVAKGVHDPHNQISYGQRSTSLQPAINGRASRFFGPTADPLPPATTGLAFEHDLPPSPSPPPPDSAYHPVHGAQGKQPLVNIPKVLKVKLPPAPNSSSQRPEPVQMPPLLRYRSGHQPIVNQIAWQDRFNGLFGRTPRTTQPASTTSGVPVQAATKSPSVPAAPIASSSRDGFYEPLAANSATVSLPHGFQQLNDLQDGADQHAETKPTEEELVDEREFGSSPTVRLFKGIHPNEHLIMTSRPIAFHRGLGGDARITQFEKASNYFPASAAALSFEYLDQDLFQSSGLRIRIRLEEKPPIIRILPRKFTNSLQSRKPKPRNQPKKAHLSNKGAKPAVNGPTGQLQESSANGNKRGPTSNSYPKPDGQKGYASENRPDRSNATVHLPGGGANVDPMMAPQPQKRKTSWAKPPRGPSRHKQNAIHA